MLKVDMTSGLLHLQLVLVGYRIVDQFAVELT